MMDKPPADMLAKVRRLRAELPHCARNCYKIKGKDGRLIPLEFNRSQLHLHQRLEEQRAKTGKVRAIIVKGRQTTISTYVSARFYHRTAMNRGIQTFILTHEQDATDNLFHMVERFHVNSPIKPSTGASNAKELYFDVLDSGYSVGTAGNKAVGRSKTIQLFDGSEVAFWANAKDHFAGVVQAVPDLPGTEIILESTANGIGGEFHERWQQAEAGIGDYQAIFIPWFWSEEYRRPLPPGFRLDDEEAEYAQMHALDLEQMAWRRGKMHELKDPLLFRQEYPATAAEAFQFTGHDSFIKAEDVVKARKATHEGIGALVVGADPARFGDDRFSLAWRKGRQVQKIESRLKVDTVAGAHWIKQVIDVDKPDRVFVDLGGTGGGVFDILMSWGEPYSKVVVGVNFGGSPREPIKYLPDGSKQPGPKNRRSEIWEASREWLTQEAGVDIPDSDALQADACAPGYHYDLDQRLILESKEHMRQRGVRSPDEWDAVALTFSEPVKIVVKRAPARGSGLLVSESEGSWMGV